MHGSDLREQPLLENFSGLRPTSVLRLDEHAVAPFQQLLLGHESIQTTMDYLGTRQNLVEAVNDRLGLGE